MKIALGIVYRAPPNEDEKGIYRSAADDALSRAAGREVLKASPPVHRVSPGEPRLPGHLTLPGLDHVAELICYVFSEEDLRELLAGMQETGEDISVIMERLDQEG